MMFEHLKERLQSVQQDFSTGFKTLGDKSKESKVLRKPRAEGRHLQFSAGLHILHRFEESWYQLHRKTKDCAQAAQQVDSDLVMLSALWDQRSSALRLLDDQLQTLPSLITDLDSITSSLAHLEGDFEEMESRMVYLETLCCQCEQLSTKQQHVKQLEAYRSKRRKELLSFEMELTSEHAQTVSHMEQRLQLKLQQKQKQYEEAFHQDVEKYLSSGFLSHTESLAPDASALDHISVADTSDLKALDDFLCSSDDESAPCGESSYSSSHTSGTDETSVRKKSITGEEGDEEDEQEDEDEDEEESSDLELEEEVLPDATLDLS